MEHEVGHAVAHEEAEDRWAYHLEDYEMKERDADELRDAVVEELQQDN